MFENETKGWYGSYSRVGKGFAERFYIISHKEEIFSRENKKIRIKDFYNPDEIKQKSSLEENLDVFKLYTSSKIKKDKILKSLLKHKQNFLERSSQNKKKSYNKKRLKLSHIHEILGIKKNPKVNQSSYTRYNPNYDYIKPRLLEGPLWKKVPGRKQKGLNPFEDKIFNDQIEENKNYKFYVLETEKSKCLVNMNKMTQRGEFTDIKDLRIRTDKPFVKPKKKKNKIEKHIKEEVKRKINDILKDKLKTSSNTRNLSLSNSKRLISRYNNNTSTMFSEPRNLLEKEIQNSSQNKTNDKDKKDKTKKKMSRIILRQIGLFEDNNKLKTENDKPNEQTESKKVKSLSNKGLNHNYSLKDNQTKSNSKIQNKEEAHKDDKKFKAPDFDKIISRKQVEKARGHKFFIIPFKTLNYSLISERPLTMINYDKSKIKNENKLKDFIGLDYSYVYKPDDIINKYNNHIPPKVPNFSIMSSRSCQKGNPLPSYMQKVHDRFYLNNMNDKSLSLNNYSNRGYFSATSSFFPKKSYNNIINYTVINSEKKNDNKKDDDIEKKIELLKLQVNYSPQVYEQLVKDGTLNKFDKVSLKSNNNTKSADKLINKKNELLYALS